MFEKGGKERNSNRRRQRRNRELPGVDGVMVKGRVGGMMTLHSIHDATEKMVR